MNFLLRAACILLFFELLSPYIRQADASVMHKQLAVVTGGNKGIGKEIARQLCKNGGCQTIIACRNLESAADAVKELQQEGCDVSIVELDISSSTSIASFVESLRDFPPVDILVNNAAIAFKDSDPTPFSQQSKPTLKTNFFGTVELTRAIWPKLKDDGRIVFVASQAGRLSILKSEELKSFFSSPTLSEDKLIEQMSNFQKDVEEGKHEEKGWPNSNYGMSKLGVIAYSNILARDHPQKLIHSCCPGYCKTDMSSQRGTKTAAQGAVTPVMLSLLSEEHLRPSGQFFTGEEAIRW